MNVTESTRKFGLVGYPLQHSLSPYLHRGLMMAGGIDADYELLEITPGDFNEKIPQLLASHSGLNITIPYKEKIIPHLHGLDEAASAVKAVNTVFHGRGFNTDRDGFLEDGPILFDRSVLILGAGGVSRMLAFAAAAERAAVVALWSRRPEQAEALAKALLEQYPDQTILHLTDPRQLKGNHWVLINGTSAGMWPQTGELPVREDQAAFLIAHSAEVYDTIYNPIATRLVLMARSAGVPARGGLGMLFHQALAAQRLWHPQAVYDERSLESLRKSLSTAVFQQFPLSLVLTGFMGSGKSTAGRLLAERLELPFVDLDEEIESSYGGKINTIFNELGENRFREMESRQLASSLNAARSQILATGGGIIQSEENRRLLRSHSALVIYLECPLPVLRNRIGSGYNRPLWRDGQGGELQKLFDRRQALYEESADRIISADQNPDQLVAALAADFGYGGDKK